MQASWAQGRRVQVQIVGTKPLLRDMGWKSGDLEHKSGMWSALEGQDAIVHIDRGPPLKIPERYIQIVTPSTVGQEVIPIEGENAGMTLKVTKMEAEYVELKNPKEGQRAQKTLFKHKILAVVRK